MANISQRRQACSGVNLLWGGILVLGLAAGWHGMARSAEEAVHDPWDKSEIILPKDLAPQVVAPHGEKPLVVYVGFDFLYKTGHILRAKFLGTGRDPKGVEALKKWAQTVPRNQQIVIYCGCCPFKECPNIRPAYEALHQMGLTQVKVLHLEDNFLKDWLQKGYPSEKGGPK